MKKRVTRRMLAGVLAVLMFLSTVAWDGLALTSVAAEAEEEKPFWASLFYTKEDMLSYIDGQADETVLDTESVVEADSIQEALSALQTNDPGEGYVLVRQIMDADVDICGYEDITIADGFQAVVLEGTTVTSQQADEENGEQENTDTPDLYVNSITLDSPKTAVYVMTDHIGLHSGADLQVAVNNADGQFGDFYFIGDQLYLESGLSGDGNINLHLKTRRADVDAVSGFHTIQFEQQKDQTESVLYLNKVGYTDIAGLEAEGVDAVLTLNYYRDGEETKAEDASLIQIKGEIITSADNFINLRYEGLCFGEEGDEHRMAPLAGEKVIDFADGAKQYAAKLRYDGKEVDENGCVVEIGEESGSKTSEELLYRGTLMDEATYRAVWNGTYDRQSDFGSVYYADTLEELFAQMDEEDSEDRDSYAAVWVQNRIPDDTYENINIPSELKGVLFLEDESAEEDATGNKTGLHTRQITMYNDTEICFDTEIRAGEGAGYAVDDELVIKGAEGTLQNAHVVAKDLYLQGQLTCSDEDQAGLHITVIDRLQAYSVKAGSLTVTTKDAEKAQVDYLRPLQIQKEIAITDETSFNILEDCHGVLFYAAELDLPATLSVSYADTGFPVYGKSVMAGGLSGSHEESVENLVVYDRVHDKDYAITADGVIAAEKYVIMLFDSEENLDKWLEEEDGSIVADQCEKENLQDGLDWAEDYDEDCYLLIRTQTDDGEGADSVEVPENVKKITLQGGSFEGTEWVEGNFALKKVVMYSSDTMLQIESPLVSDDGTFTVVWPDTEGGEIFFAAEQNALVKVVSCDEDGEDSGVLLVPAEKRVVLPFIDQFGEIKFQGGTLVLTAEKRTYRFASIVMEAESNLVLPRYHSGYVPEFCDMETENIVLNVSFQDTSAMDYGCRIVKYTNWEYEEVLRDFLRVSLPFGILDSEGVLRKIAILEDTYLEYQFTYEDAADIVRLAEVVLTKAPDADIVLSEKNIVASDSGTVCRNVVNTVTVSEGDTEDSYTVEIGITKNFGPQELYLWYTSEKESFVIAKLDVYQEVEEIKIVKVYDLEPVTYSYGMPEVENPEAYAIFPATVKVLLSDGRQLELKRGYPDDGGLTACPEQTTTFTLTAEIYTGYEFAEGVSNTVSYQVTVVGKPYEIKQTDGLAAGVHPLSVYEENPEFVFESDTGDSVTWYSTFDDVEPDQFDGSSPMKEMVFDLSYILKEDGKATIRLYIAGDDKHPASKVYTYEYRVAYDDYNITVEKIETQQYTGAQIKPAVKAYDGDKLLTVNKDYTLSYKNNINVATADSEEPPTVILKGKGIYSDTIEIPFTIGPRDFTGVSGGTYLPLKEMDGVWVADLKDIEVTVKDGKKVLKEGTDYTLSYGMRVEFGEYKRLDSSFVITTDRSTTGMIIVNGIANYAGATIVHDVHLSSQEDFCKAKITLAQSKVTYMGDGEQDNWNPVTVWLDGKIVDPKYYEVSYKNNKQPGIATVSVTTKDYVDDEVNIYDGTVSATYPIVRAKFSEAVFGNKGKIADREYAFGEPVTVKNGEDYLLTGRRADGRTETAMLVEGVDYEVTYQKNINAGTATVIFTALDSGVYTGSLKKTFKIVKPALFVKNTSTKRMELNENLQILVVSENNIFRTVLSGNDMGTMGSLVFDEYGAVPEVYVQYKGVQLKEGVDYKLSVANNKKVSTYDKNGKPAKYAAITITGKGNFTGTLKGSLKDVPGLTYTVEPQWVLCADTNRLDEADCGAQVYCSIPSVVYKKGDKTVYKPVPVIISGDTDKKLAAGKDYTVTYLDNTNKNIPVDEKTGLPTETVYQEVKIEFKGNYRGEAICTYAVAPYDFNKLVVTVDKQTYEQNQEVPLSDIHVKVSKNSKEELKEGVDYTIAWDMGRSRVGTSELCIEGMGAYNGLRVIKYTVEKAKLDWNNENFRITVKGDNIYGEPGSSVYMDKKGAVPEIYILYGHRILKEGKDYTVSFTNNKAVTTDSKPAVFKITGKGDFTGTISDTYRILPTSLYAIGWKNQFKVQIQPVVYSPTAKSYNVKLTVKQNGVLLKEGTDYRIVYKQDENGKYSNDASNFTEEEVSSKLCYLSFYLEGIGSYEDKANMSIVVWPAAFNKMNVTFENPLDYGVTTPEGILAQAKITYKIGKNTYTLNQDTMYFLGFKVQNVSVNGLNGKAVLTTTNGAGSKSFTFKYNPKSVK